MISESCIRARNWLSLRISRTAPLNSRRCLWISLFRSCSSFVLPCFLPNSSLEQSRSQPQDGRSTCVLAFQELTELQRALQKPACCPAFLPPPCMLPAAWRSPLRTTRRVQPRTKVPLTGLAWEPHLQLGGVAAAGQVLRQEGSERPHEVMEGGQRAVQAHTAPHQGQAHGQAGQPAGESNFRATGSGQHSTLNPAGRSQPGSQPPGEAVARERPGWGKHCPQAEQHV